MSIEVVDWSPRWAAQYDEVAAAYLAGKSAVLQQVIEASGRMTRAEMDAIRRLNGG